MKESTPQQRFVADAADAGTRLDAFLTAKLAPLSRAHVSRMIELKNVSVQGVAPKKLKPSLRLTEGMEITFEGAADNAAILAPNPAITLDIRFEDDSIVVLNKPPGLAVHPQHADATNTLVNALLARYGGKLPAPPGKELAPGIVHRLDSDTSGVMVCALTETAYESLKRQFRDREVEKAYVAVVRGRPRADEFAIEAGIERDPQRGHAMRARKEGGRAAATHFRVLERFDGYTVMEARPLTGRTHQIRVHLASHGLPVVGDKLYGGMSKRTSVGAHDAEDAGDAKEPPLPIARQALHAASLALTHPSTGTRMVFTAALPQDMQTLIAELRMRTKT